MDNSKRRQMGLPLENGPETKSLKVCESLSGNNPRAKDKAKMNGSTEMKSKMDIVELRELYLRLQRENLKLRSENQFLMAELNNINVEVEKLSRCTYEKPRKEYAFPIKMPFPPAIRQYTRIKPPCPVDSAAPTNDEPMSHYLEVIIKEDDKNDLGLAS